MDIIKLFSTQAKAEEFVANDVAEYDNYELSIHLEVVE